MNNGQSTVEHLSFSVCTLSLCGIALAHFSIEYLFNLAALIGEALIPSAVGLGLGGKVTHTVAQLALFHIL